MMKTPDKIKTGLEHCAEDGCKTCPYDDDCDMADGFSVLAADAIALIQQLEKQNRCLQENKESLEKRMIDLAQRMPRWISVEERLPEDRPLVMMYTHGCELHEGLYLRTTGFEFYDKVEKPWSWKNVNALVTHWMPLPLPPSSPFGESTSLEDGGSGTN